MFVVASDIELMVGYLGFYRRMFPPQEWQNSCKVLVKCLDDFFESMHGGIPYHQAMEELTASLTTHFPAYTKFKIVVVDNVLSPASLLHSSRGFLDNAIHQELAATETLFHFNQVLKRLNRIDETNAWLIRAIQRHQLDGIKQTVNDLCHYLAPRRGRYRFYRNAFDLGVLFGYLLFLLMFIDICTRTSLSYLAVSSFLNGSLDPVSSSSEHSTTIESYIPRTGYFFFVFLLALPPLVILHKVQTSLGNSIELSQQRFDEILMVVDELIEHHEYPGYHELLNSLKEKIKAQPQLTFDNAPESEDEYPIISL